MPSARRPPAGLLRAAVVMAAQMVLVLVATARPAAAQPGERITSYDVDLRIETDGDLAITEVIAYDFGSADRHGIFRHVPVRLRYDGNYDRVYPLDIVSVSGSSGTPDDYEVASEGSRAVIRIGDPDRTISGLHTYTIAYRLRAALNGFADHDELYWNAVGHQWDVPIDRASVRLQAPAGITSVTCFRGPERSSLPCDRAVADGPTAHFTQAGLAPREAVTVVAAIPKGVVPAPRPVLDERWTPARAFSATPATVGVAGGLLALLVAGVGALAWKVGRDRRYVGSHVEVAFGNTGGAEEPVSLLERPLTPVELAPPDGLRPGQVGTLVDEIANPLDVTATIVDLAVRGYLRIEEIPKQGWFGKPDWRLVRLERDAGDPAAEGGDLRRYERLLLSSLFAGHHQDGGAQVQLSELRDTFAARLADVQDELYADAVRQGWFTHRPDQARTRWRAIGIVVLAVGVVLTAVAAAVTRLGLLPLPIVAAGMLLTAFASRMPRRTARGTGTLRRVVGFRRFIEDSERERAQFAERQHLFSEYLPYAIVFGVTEKWARAFSGLDRAGPELSWYVGTHPFTTAGFAHSIDGFTVSTAGTITSTPSGSGSSGFGGGGFSGGGGGGGGGGSW